MNIILIGPPGCGKGTQAEKITESFKLTHLATGDLIREEIAEKSALGKKVKQIIDDGHLIDDETITQIVRSRIKDGDNVLFDGYPRTVEQAHAIDKFHPVDIVIDIQVGDSEVMARIGHRWMVTKNHKQHSFKSEEDAKTFAKEHGGTAFQRDDDKPDTIKERLLTYHKRTEPIIAYYGKQHKLFIVNGEKSVDNVWSDIKKIIEKQY